MKHAHHRLIIILAVTLTLGLTVGVALGQRGAKAGPAKPAVVEDRIALYFSPDGGIAPTIVSLIDSTRQSVYLDIYTFTHNDIGQALIDAHERGVKVEVVIDHHQGDIPGSERIRLRQAGIPFWVAPEANKMHHKTLIIDERLVATGSYNFTYAAESKNFENLLIIDQKPKLTAAFVKNHEVMKKVSKEYKSD